MTSLRCPKTFAKVHRVSLPAPSRHGHALAVYRLGDAAFGAAVDAWSALESRRGWSGDAAATQAFAEQAMRVAAALKAFPGLAETVAALPPTPGLDRPWKPAPGSFVRCDVVSANWSALRILAPSLPESFAAFAENLGVWPIFATSKTFRQYAIGNTWPKRLAQLQAADTRRVADVMSLGADAPVLVGATHDELVFAANDDVRRVAAILIRAVTMCDARPRSLPAIQLRRRVEIFTCAPLILRFPDDTEREVGFVLDVGEASLETTSDGTAEILVEPRPRRRVTYGVHGRLAVAVHRQVVLGQLPEPDDFLYEDEGLLCSVIGSP